VDYDQKCLTSTAAECTGRYIGQLQPYALYVPAKPLPSKGFGLVVSMHGLSANYNEFLGSHEAEELGNRGTGSILCLPGVARPPTAAIRATRRQTSSTCGPTSPATTGSIPT